MIKTKHKYLDFPPGYLEEADNIFYIWGWKEFCMPLVILIGFSFLVYWIFMTAVPGFWSHFNIETPTGRSVLFWGIASCGAVSAVYYFVLLILVFRQICKIKDYEDIPFHTAQRLYSWKSSSDFVAAVCENRPAFEEKHFAGLWETEKETAIANLMRESYSKAVKQYSDFYFLPEDRFDIITFATVNTFSCRETDNSFDILKWLCDLDEKLNINLLKNKFRAGEYAGMTMKEIVKLCAQQTALETGDIRQIHWEEADEDEL